MRLSPEELDVVEEDDVVSDDDEEDVPGSQSSPHVVTGKTTCSQTSGMQ